jgi:hypothetical protein
MEKEFVPYELALRMKQLGFDEPSLYAWCNKGGRNEYTGKEEPIIQVLRTDGNPFGNFFNGKNWNIEIVNNAKSNIQCSAPLFQQAFRWFRENHDLNYVIVKAESWFYTINGCNTQEGFKTYEEAELACLTKLIKIVQGGNNE